MHAKQRERARELLDEKGITCALFAEAANVTWLMGFALPDWPGTDLYAGGPPLVWFEDGRFTLIVFDGAEEEAARFAELPDCGAIVYPGYAFEERPSAAGHLKTIVNELASGKSQIGLETRFLPTFLAQTMAGNTAVTPIDGWLNPLRMVKTGEELAKMRANFALIDKAHDAARRAIQAGKTELDVWLATHAALQQAAGMWLPLIADCTVGRRANEGGPPQNVKIWSGDSFVLDLGTHYRGYWSDSCVTYYAGEMSEKQKEMHWAVSDALDLAISLVRPGAAAKEIDRQVRQSVAAAGFPVYPHHTGHGIGARVHEAPWIAPYSDDALQAGMVIMLEPGIYFAGETAVRLEKAILVTESGAEILTTYRTEF